MIRQFRLHPWAYVALMLMALQGCGADRETAATETTLPYFNRPDWTPEWIAADAAGYDSIHAIPPFSLLDQRGATVTEKDLNGRICVVDWFFVTCRSICPRLTGNMRLLQEAYAADSSVLLLSHTVDPERDGVAQLARYAEATGVAYPKWRLLTGPRDSIYRLARREYFAGDSIGYFQAGDEFLHTENFILLDARRRIRGVYNGTLRTEIDRIAADIRTLREEME